MNTDRDQRPFAGGSDAPGTGDGHLGRLLMERIADVELTLLDEPHVLVCTDANGVTTCFGPFPDAFAAMDQVAGCEDDQTVPGRGVNCTVAPLFPA